jgi:3D (Asp-Asp-Asp) domain-containing protein
MRATIGGGAFTIEVMLAGSLWRKVIVTSIAAGGFVALYEVTMLDSQNLPWRPARAPESTPPSPGARLTFAATAYCKGMVTAAGTAVKAGVAASDPSLLPLGSIVELDVDDGRYDGIYSVLDTGPSVQGREIDIYMWSCHEALRFGRRSVRLTVLRLGWNPKATTPTFMDRLFRRATPAPASREPIPSHPLPTTQ